MAEELPLLIVSVNPEALQVVERNKEQLILNRREYSEGREDLKIANYIEVNKKRLYRITSDTSTVYGMQGPDGSYLPIENSSLSVIRQQTNDFIGDPRGRKKTKEGKGKALVETIPPRPPILSSLVVFITYTWTSGRDLDTHTTIIAEDGVTLISGPVGFSLGSATANLIWNGDSTGEGGQETVTYTVKRSEVGADSFFVRVGAYWFGEPSSSPVRVDVDTLLNGVLIQRQTYSGTVSALFSNAIPTIIGTARIVLL